jgi:hypothetical protein
MGEEIVEMFKFGTVSEMAILGVREKVPEKVYLEALRVAAMLDDLFGKDRDVEFDDGGFVFIAENRDDLDYFSQNCVDLDSELLEYVEVIPTDNEPYLNAFFLYNEYESGITLLIPMSVAPERFLREASLEAHKA